MALYLYHLHHRFAEVRFVATVTTGRCLNFFSSGKQRHFFASKYKIYSYILEVYTDFMVAGLVYNVK